MIVLIVAAVFAVLYLTFRARDVVTNEYHVLRTALLARSIGSDAQVIGSRTVTYYVPSAFLCEFVAGVWESFQQR